MAPAMMRAGVSSGDVRDRRLWAPRAWIAGGWREHVLLAVGRDGCWSEVACNVARTPADAIVLPGPALPGLVDAHSHAFQRAFAGLAERREAGHDDFWSWRERMYAVANRITPSELCSIATRLYDELLAGGYTQVCEFHYLQHAPDGCPYDDPLATSEALVDAARATGIGLTLLPVLYERSGFAARALRPEQRRFATTADAVVAMRDAARSRAWPLVNTGVAIHSLRAAAPASIARLIEHCAHDAGPIHIHVAEQVAEVDDCVAATGARPIAWLARNVALDARWQLVHATHVEDDEIAAVAGSGAGVVLCPSTEANLGDGLTNLEGWLTASVPLSVGSDSQVTRDWREELRLAEYGQRLVQRRRNVAAAPSQGFISTAERLFDRILAGGAQAAGFPSWGLVKGARADLLVVDEGDSAVAGIPPVQLLDAMVFVSPVRPWRDVLVAGRWVARDGARESRPGA